MTRIKLKNIDRFVDRHGKTRYYYRAGKGKRTKLPGFPGSPEFMLAYEEAVRGHPVEREQRMRGDPGTFDRLVQEYFSSMEFRGLAASTQKTYRSVIERLLIDENIGHRLVREMRREHVRAMIARRAETPGAANSLLQKIKVLIHFAIDNGWRSDDPTLRIKKFAKGEFHTWTEEEIAAYEAKWPVGSTARLAFALLLYTGQRRSDVVTMSWSDVKDGAIGVVPLKTQRTTGVRLWIPIHPALAEALAAADRVGETILTTSFGKAFTGNGFGNFMADKIADAGLPDQCVTHGLRKAAARRLAEAGCTTNEIAAITGHATLQEVARYTKAAEQKRLAQTAIKRLQTEGRKPATETLPGESFSQTGSEGLGKIANFAMISTPNLASAIPLGSTNRLFKLLILLIFFA
jgi:integrase